MATFEYLTALCDLKRGQTGSAQEALRRVEKLCGTIRPPAADDNVLVVVFAGQGPAKSQIGEHKEILLLTQGPCETTSVELAAPAFGRPPAFVDASRTDDMNYQAMTRGGRAIDEVNKRKASAKDAAEVTAKTAAAAASAALSFAAINAMLQSSQQSGSDDAQAALLIVAAALIVIAVTAWVVAEMIKPDADIRRIQSVPAGVYLWSGRLLPGRHSLAVRRLSSAQANPAIAFLDVDAPYDNDHNVVLLFLP